MWYFMAGMEGSTSYISEKCLFGLMTFYGLYGSNLDKTQEKFEKTLPYLDKILIDSGAYSFRVSNKNGDFESYVNKYVEFVKRNANNPQIVGFFEMDIDSIVGYEKVLEYRAKLEQYSDKVIPVWHQNRGINEFIEMCKKYSGKRVAVACVGWHDMYPYQLNLFINTAHKYGCKIHILGMTSAEVIKNSNLGLEDSFDSVGWLMADAYANICLYLKEDLKQVSNILGKLEGLVSTKLHGLNYICFRKIQEYYKNIDQSIPII